MPGKVLVRGFAPEIPEDLVVTFCDDLPSNAVCAHCDSVSAILHRDSEGHGYCTSCMTMCSKGNIFKCPECKRKCHVSQLIVDRSARHIIKTIKVICPNATPEYPVQITFIALKAHLRRCSCGQMTKCPHCHEEFTKRLVGPHVKDCKALRKPQPTQKQQVLSPELVEFMKETLTEIRYLKTEIAELHLYQKGSESQINVQKNEIAKLKMELSQKDETIQQLTVVLRSTQDDVQNLKVALSRKQGEHELLTETVLSHQIDMKNIQAQCEKHHEVIKQMTSDMQENNLCWRTCCQELSS
ncbi:hypothetical protein V5799_017910 [Amblyomma americanum]|uniref:Uncharacterized protein n=1 Tax=Amblyomma americanum TaxID=6943 RepID=A0AAQ4F1T6_AMBAM